MWPYVNRTNDAKMRTMEMSGYFVENKFQGTKSLPVTNNQTNTCLYLNLVLYMSEKLVFDRWKTTFM